MKEKKTNTIEFTYQKSPDYKAHLVEGIVGGITPKGKISIDFFNEKSPIPDSVTHELSNNGILGKEVNRKGKKGIVREIESGIYLDIPTAMVLVDWLNIRIAEFKKRTKGNG